MLKFVLPYNMDTTLTHFAEAGYSPNFIDDEKDLGVFNLNGEDYGSIIRARSFDVPLEVAAGKDIGLCGSDWVNEKERELDLGLIVEASYSYGRKPQTVPTLDFITREDSPIRSIRDAKPGDLFLGEYPNLIMDEITAAGLKVEQFGKNPEAPRNPELFQEWCKDTDQVGFRIVHGRISALVADSNAIGVMINETGSTLRKKNLKKLETLQEVKTLLIINPRSLKDTQKTDEIRMVTKELNLAYIRSIAGESESTPLMKEAANARSGMRRRL